MTHTNITIGIVVALALAVVTFFFFFASPSTSQTSATEGQGSAQLIAQDEQVGTGPIATAGSTVTVNYVGKLQNGTVFDSTAGKTPFTFVLGIGKVIPGWDQGVQGMKVGGRRLLIIPPQLGYGAQAVGPIPANSTLVFEVTLLNVSAATTTPAQAQ